MVAKLASSFTNDTLGEEGGKTQYEAGHLLRADLTSSVPKQLLRIKAH